MNDLLLKPVLFAILKNVLRISVEKLWYIKRVILKGLSNDFVIINMRYCNNGEVNLHLLNTWIKA